MSLENALRGTGDFGAMSEVVWGIRQARRWVGKSEDKEYAKESAALTRLEMECLKGRDIPNVADPFVIQGRPYIEERGDFSIIESGGLAVESLGLSTEERLAQVVRSIQADSKVSIRSLVKLTGWNNDAVKKHAASEGWLWAKSGWEHEASKTAVQTNIILSQLDDLESLP
jgi:hypothetical protein